jgi:hypothetical protein
MKNLVYILVVSLIATSCSPKKEPRNYVSRNLSEDKQDEHENGSEEYTLETERANADTESNSKYADGVFCAEVYYYNPNTATHSKYTLTVEVENNEVIQINWPNSGWLDNDHFYNAELDDNGYTNFTSDKGYDYEIQIIGEAAGCFTNVPMARQCIGTTNDGDQCENMTDNPNSLCWMHQEQE